MVRYVHHKYLDIAIFPEYKNLLYSMTNWNGYREYNILYYQWEVYLTRYLCTENSKYQKTVIIDVLKNIP